MSVLATSIILYSLLMTFVHCRHTKFTGCNINYDLNLEKEAPIFITNNANKLGFIFPNDGNIRLKEGEQMIVACPGARNNLQLTNSNITTAKCISRNQFEAGRKKVSSEELLCKKTVRADVLETKKTCAEGRIYQIGYKINRDWINLINLCYDSDRGNTLFTQHKLVGEELNGASKTNYRPSFSSAGLSSDTPANVVYKQAFQKSTFNSLLKSTLLAEQYINSKSYLARGHLSPDADFLLSTWQYATYFYINTCGKWNSVNNGNWKRIENLVRKTASTNKKTYTVFTGTLDVLKLPDVNGKLVDIMLANNKIPVPKFVWKVIIDEVNNEGIAMIILNNPFIKTVTRDDILCNCICEQYGWINSHWKNIERGYVQCCKISDVIHKIRQLPMLDVKGVLKGVN